MNQQELMDAYLQGKLSKEDRELFEKLVAESPADAAELEQMRQVRQAIVLESRQQLRNVLEEAEGTRSNSNRSGKAKMTSFKSWLISGVAACVIVFAGYFLWIQLSQSAGEKVFNAYYEVYPNLIAPSTRGESANGQEAEAFLAYDQHEYAKAAIIFSALSKKENKAYLRFYLGICQLETDRPELAIPAFQGIPVGSEGVSDAAKDWYLAMAYLKMDKVSEAKAVLQKVAGIKGPFQTKAREILEKK